MLDTCSMGIGEDLFLGVDGGGTKTEFAVVSADGYLVKRIVKNGCNPNDIGYAATRELICGSIEDILAEFPSVRTAFLGIAGITAGNNRTRLELDLRERFSGLKTDVKSDSFNLFALDGSADMAVISGTGSVVFVKQDGGYKRLGGWGYLIDAAGSAYDIGRDLVREALREEDMHEPYSIMSDMLRKKLNTDTVWEQVNCIYSGGRAHIASLASVVFDAYRKGDEKAYGIVDNSAKALAEWLNAGVRLYGAHPVAIASGGLFEHYGDIMTSHIGKYSNVRLSMSDLPPIYGACRTACLMKEDGLSDKFYENFKNTYGEIKK